MSEENREMNILEPEEYQAFLDNLSERKRNSIAFHLIMTHKSALHSGIAIGSIIGAALSAVMFVLVVGGMI